MPLSHDAAFIFFLAAFRFDFFACCHALIFSLFMMPGAIFAYAAAFARYFRFR